MTVNNALDMVSTYAPCPHEEYAVLGYGQLRRCEYCGDTFPTASADAHRLNAQKFENAVDVLRSLIKPTPAEAGNP